MKRESRVDSFGILVNFLHSLTRHVYQGASWLNKNPLMWCEARHGYCGRDISDRSDLINSLLFSKMLVIFILVSFPIQPSRLGGWNNQLESPHNLCVQLIPTGHPVLSLGSLRTSQVKDFSHSLHYRENYALFSTESLKRLFLTSLLKLLTIPLPWIPLSGWLHLLFRGWQRSFSISSTLFLPLNF